MVKCTIIIEELDDGRIAFFAHPDQTNATKHELLGASIMDKAVEAMGELMLKHNKDGTMAAGDGQSITEYVKEWVENAEKRSSQ